MWKYEVSNTDHSLMQGVELVNRLMLGEAETTIGMKYASTEDGRNAAVHERSQLAGSGDPKKEKDSPDVKTKTVVAHPGTISRRENLAKTHTDPGDKQEAHVSEEELGVTQYPVNTPKRKEHANE